MNNLKDPNMSVKIMIDLDGLTPRQQQIAVNSERKIRAAKQRREAAPRIASPSNAAAPAVAPTPPMSPAAKSSILSRGMAALIKGDVPASTAAFITQDRTIEIPISQLARNLYCPLVLVSELNNSPVQLADLKLIAATFPKIVWLVTSVKSDFLGKLRAADTSHFRNQSVDIAGMVRDPKVSKHFILYSPRMNSPRFADNRNFLEYLAKAAERVTRPIALAAEGDHIHVTTSLPAGAYAYSTYRSEYKLDTQAHSAANIARKLMRVTSDGSITASRK
jgi:hypothetical protein